MLECFFVLLKFLLYGRCNKNLKLRYEQLNVRLTQMLGKLRIIDNLDAWRAVDNRQNHMLQKKFRNTLF